VYGKELEERLDSLRKLQRYLGEMNDCVAGVRLLKQMDGPAKAIKRLKRQRYSRLASFQRYWRKFEAEEDSWVKYLAAP
jgi:CHAD domain-containing protein